MISNKLTKIVYRPILLLAVCLIVAVIGCGPAGRLVESAEPYRTNDYQQAFERWTREARIYRGFDVELIVSATFKSSDYRRAYAKEYTKAYLLSDKEGVKFEKDQLAAAEEFHDFVMATFIPDDRWNDFEKKDSTWKIYLTNEQNKRISPVEIRKLNGKDPRIEQFFPYVSPWREVYAVRFPAKPPGHHEDLIGPDARSMTLTITGVRGTCDMVWELK